MLKFRYFPLAAFAAFVFTGVYAGCDGRWAVGLTLAVGLAATVMVRRNVIASSLSGDLDSTLSDRTYFWFWAIAIVGLCLRICAVFEFKAPPLGDASGFWREICHWGKGHFCLTKSYTMVAFYGFVAMVLGKSLLVVGLANSALGVVQTYLSFWLARRLFRNDAAGIFAAAVTSLNPIAIYSAQLVMSETLFATLMLAFFAMWLATMEDWYARTAKARRAFPVAAGILGALTFYCRGNGLFLIAAAMAAMVCTLAAGGDRRGFVLRICLPFLLGVGAVTAPVVAVNRAVYGHFVLGSSDDSVWPLLAGSDVATEGRWAPSNYARYRAKFKELTGRDDFSLYRDTHIVAPYIKAEIAERWKTDPKAQLRLGWTKYLKLWSAGGEWAYGNRSMDERFKTEVRTWHFDLLNTSMRRVKELLAICAIACFAMLPFMRREGVSLTVAMLVFLALNVVNHFFCEEKPRYCWLLWTLLSVWASGVVVPFLRLELGFGQQKEKT